VQGDAGIVSRFCQQGADGSGFYVLGKAWECKIKDLTPSRDPIPGS